MEIEKQKLSCETTDWLNSQTKEIELNVKLANLKLQQQKIKDYDKKIENLKNKQKNKRGWKKIEKNKELESTEIENIDDDDIILEDLVPGINDESDEEIEEDKYKPVQVFCFQISFLFDSLLVYFIDLYL